nr:MAG TPA: hypothetical protein [Caudoviricetes sp.]
MFLLSVFRVSPLFSFVHRCLLVVSSLRTYQKEPPSGWVTLNGFIYLIFGYKKST